MQYRKLGKTEVNVSVIAFGCWGLIGGEYWGEQSEQDSIQAIRTAYDLGINLFDTAEGYGDGFSERILGKALHGIRPNVLIASKVSPDHFSPPELRRACERSLRNLGTDWIDLYQLHWPNWEIPLAEPLQTMEDLRKEGKIRFYGVSNFGVGDLGEALAGGFTISSDQLAYNLLFRAIEYEILPLCRRESVSVLCYSPLMQGLLAGKFPRREDVPVKRSRSRHFSSQTNPEARHGEAGAEEETFTALEQMVSLSEESGFSMSDLSLGWLIAQPGVTSVIAGARRPEHARTSAGAADVKLTPDVLERLSQITEPLKQKLGPNPDMWQAQPRIR